MKRSLLLPVLLLGAQVVVAQAPAPKAKPSQPAFCSACHQAEPGTVAGYFDSVAFKSNSIQLDVGAGPEILRFDPKTVKVVDAGVEKNAEHLREVKKRHETRIAYVEKDGVKHATQISFKGPIKIDAAKLIDQAGVARLVEQGPDKGQYTLIDSRPLPRFEEGAIPTAIHLPFIGFDKFADRLPADKSRLVVFYCGGITCTLSPNSLRKAEKMGYTNLRVYREGLPDWQTRHYAVADAAVPEGGLHRQGHSACADRCARDRQRHLGAHQGCGLRAGGAAETGARVAARREAEGADHRLRRSRRRRSQGRRPGHRRGRAAERAGAAGRIGRMAERGPGHRLGRTGGNEDRLHAEAARWLGGGRRIHHAGTNTPANVLILDVRNPDEANAGMIKGALLIPDEEIAARMAEIPKDKRILTHCLTGIRAEMAYHKLKDAGYDVAFLNADIEVAKDGSFKITPR